MGSAHFSVRRRMSRRWLTAVLPVMMAIFMAGLPEPGLAQGASPPRQNFRPGHYIVVLRDSISDARPIAAQLAGSHGLGVGYVYNNALKGFSASIPEAALQAIRNNPNVAYVEQDQEMRAFAQETPTGIQRTYADGNLSLDIDGQDDLRVDVDVAVLDTGIDFDHPDLHVIRRADCSGGGPINASCVDNSGDDGNGHGTHVAGSIAALDNGFGVVGVAPGARLWAIKVLKDNGSGWNSGIIAGIDWLTARADQVEVANMSLGGGDSKALCDTIRNSTNVGVVYAVAAGNSDANAANYSPANCADVITVSALADFDGLPAGAGSPTCRNDQDDTLADFSNWGSTIELAAPGVCILSTWNGGGYNTISGTSMASPHVAGAAAILASGTGKPTNRDQVLALRQSLITAGNYDWVDDSGDGTQERLLDVSNMAATTVAGSGSGDSTDGTPPVISNVSVASITASSAEIRWTTDEASDSVVRYGTTWPLDASASVASVATPVRSHVVGLSGLSGGTTYYFEVQSTDSSDNTATDNNFGTYYSFTTAAASSISLSASGHKVKGVQHVDLQWSGASSTSIDIWRNGSKVVSSTANDGFHTDNIGQKGGGAYTYKVCEAGASTCSNEVVVTF